MKERPILFKQPHANEMVRAILDGRKTQMRMPMKEQPHEGSKFHGMVQCFGELRALFWCEGQPSNYGTPLPMHVGDRLWVKETFAAPWGKLHEKFYRADDPKVYKSDGAWTPSIHTPRWASRIDLEITRVWVERVQDITEEDAESEGVDLRKLCGCQDGCSTCDDRSPRIVFRDLWQSIYGTWDANPFVWAYEFRRIKP